MQVTKWFYCWNNVFIKKWYHETRLLKRVHNDFIQKFPNSVSLSNNAILNLIKTIWKQTYTRWFTMLGMTANGDFGEEGGGCKECHGTPHHIIMMVSAASGRAFKHVNIWNGVWNMISVSGFSLPHIKFWFNTSQSQLIHQKRVKLCRWFHNYTYSNVSEFDAFFLSGEVWFHLDGYIKV